MASRKRWRKAGTVKGMSVDGINYTFTVEDVDFRWNSLTGHLEREPSTGGQSPTQVGDWQEVWGGYLCFKMAVGFAMGMERPF